MRKRKCKSKRKPDYTGARMGEELMKSIKKWIRAEILGSKR